MQTLDLFPLFTCYKVKRRLSRDPFPGYTVNMDCYRPMWHIKPCPCFPGFNFQSTWSHEYCSPRVEVWFTVAWLYIKPTHRVNRQVTQSIAITLQGHPYKQPTVWSVWAWLPINELWPFSPILPVGRKPNPTLGVVCGHVPLLATYFTNGFKMELPTRKAVRPSAD